MANKKLKVELELETAKAKRQAKGLENLGGPGGGGASPAQTRTSASADRLANSLDRAAKRSDGFADEAERMSGSTRSLIRGFTGIGVGMAMNYASTFMPQGKGREAVEVGASAVQGASTVGLLANLLPGGPLLKAALGLGGAAAGGLTEKAKQDKANKDYTDEWNRSEKQFREGKDFSDRLRSLTEVEDGFKDFKARLNEINEELKARKTAEHDLKQSIIEAIAAREYEKANRLREDLATNRAQQQSLEGAARHVEKTEKDEQKREEEKKKREEEKKEEARKRSGVAYYSGTDALAKVGGGAGRVPSATVQDTNNQAPATKSFGGSFFFSGGPAKKMDTTFFTQDRTDPTMKAANERIAQLEKDGNDILKQIAENTKRKEGSTWQ